MAPLNAPAGPATGPSPDLVELMVRALALPGANPGNLHQAIRARGHVGGPRAVIAAKSVDLTAADRDRSTGWADRVLETIARGSVRALVAGFAGYPEALMALKVPPPIVFVRGDVSRFDEPAVAVVGTRRASHDALRIAERMARDLAAAGAVVVSGLARGIDAAAHRGAGASRTIGVLGCGVDVVYPRSNGRLQADIGRCGLLISERLPGTPPYPYLFPERNRIIAALARAVVVIQAPLKSGALITADAASDLDRPIFAVPGSITEAAYAGSNMRIRDGLATLVTGAAEVLPALGLEAPADPGDRPPPELEGVGLALWRAAGDAPAHADDLADAVGLDASQGLASLLTLELQGHLRQLPGMRFVRDRAAPAMGDRTAAARPG